MRHTSRLGTRIHTSRGPPLVGTLGNTRIVCYIYQAHSVSSSFRSQVSFRSILLGQIRRPSQQSFQLAPTSSRYQQSPSLVSYTSPMRKSTATSTPSCGTFLIMSPCHPHTYTYVYSHQHEHRGLGYSLFRHSSPKSSSMNSYKTNFTRNGSRANEYLVGQEALSRQVYPLSSAGHQAWGVLYTSIDLPTVGTIRLV